MNASFPDEWFDRFPVLAMTDKQMARSAAADPVVAQIRGLFEPRRTFVCRDGHREEVPAPWWSPGANDVAFLTEGLTRARSDVPQNVPPDERRILQWEASGSLDDRMKAKAARQGLNPSDSMTGMNLRRDEYPPRVLLNTGRPPQPSLPRRREYVKADLVAHEAHRQYYEGPQVVDEIAEAEELWRIDYERIDAGGFFAQTVVMHDAGTVGTEVFPVPVFGSPARVVRLLLREPHAGNAEFGWGCCWWCEHDQLTPIDALMLVTCGPTLRVFPTCPECHDEAMHAAERGGVNFLYVGDRSFFRQGMPDDMYLDRRVTA